MSPYIAHHRSNWHRFPFHHILALVNIIRRYLREGSQKVQKDLSGTLSTEQRLGPKIGYIAGSSFKQARYNIRKSALFYSVIR